MAKKTSKELLDEAFGRTTQIAGTKDERVYAEKIAKMDKNQLFSHGMKEYGIVPSEIADRKSFEARCAKHFKKKLTNGLNKVVNLKPRRRSKSYREKLQKALEATK